VRIHQELRRSMAIDEFSLEGAVVGFGSRSSRVSTYCHSSVCRDVRVEHVISRGNGRISQ